MNLDNRPVFPRDRACAEAWQRGGVQEEIAERKRWIERDQEKVMQSVRHLIKMRDENRAKREAREQEERERLGLPPVVPEDKENITESKSTEMNEENAPEPERVETKDGVLVDMLSGSEADDSTSDSSSDSDTDSNRKDDDGETSKIEWSQVDSGRRLVQELKEDEPTEDQWGGFMAGTANSEDKQRALEQLLPIYQQLKQHATVEDVKKKINSLRSNYNRELKKYESSQTGENSYYPKVRYFPYLSFLRKSKQHDRQGESTSILEETNSPQNIKVEVKSLLPRPKDTVQSQYTQPKLIASIKTKVNKKEQLEEARNSYHSQPYPSQDHQPYVPCNKISHPIALEWSETLSRLDPLQRLYAKKAINDVLFEAELGNLHRHSVRINESDSYYFKTSPSQAGSDDADPGPSSSQMPDPISIKHNQQTPEREYKHPITYLHCSLENDDVEQDNVFGD